MDINSQMVNSLSSIRQAIDMSNMQKAIKQDQQSMTSVIEMANQNTQMLERSVSPHKGQSIDIRV